MSDYQQSCNEEQLLDLLEQLQTENEKQKIQIAELTDSKNSLNAENEKMLIALEQLQQDNEKIRLEQHAVAPLIQTIREQEQQLTSLEQQNNLLRGNSEKLLKLSEQERKLSSENNSLKQSVRELQSEIKKKEREIANLTTQVEDSADRFKQLSQTLPSKEDIQSFSKAVRGAEKAVESTHILNIGNYLVVGVFVILVAFTGYQVYQTRNEMETASQSIQDALYNAEGWAVLEGTVQNEWVWGQKHPEAYQRYLERKQQQQQGLK